MSDMTVPTLEYYCDDHCNIQVTIQGTQIVYKGNDWGGFEGKLFFVTEEDARHALAELSRRLQAKIASGKKSLMKISEIFTPAISFPLKEKKFG